MKRKLSMTLKSLSALLISVALVLSTAGPARAEVGYAPEKCSGSKYVCDFWSTNDESTDGSWRFFACYKKKVSVKIQVKKGSSWKNVKGASAKGKKSDESCNDKYPYAVSVEVFEKSKGTKTYRLVENEKGKSPYTANFKVKVRSFNIETSTSPSGSQSSFDYDEETYNYIADMYLLFEVKGQSTWIEAMACAASASGASSLFGRIANSYKSGELSAALALAKATSLLNEYLRDPCIKPKK
jgi:hypothetical protein